MAVALVTNVDFFPRGDGLYIYYNSNLKSEGLSGKKRIFIDKKNLFFVGKLLNGKSLPLLIDSNDFNNNELPITNLEFKEAGFNRPDTLEYIYLTLDSLVSSR